MLQGIQENKIQNSQWFQTSSEVPGAQSPQIRGKSTDRLNTLKRWNVLLTGHQNNGQRTLLFLYLLAFLPSFTAHRCGIQRLTLDAIQNVDDLSELVFYTALFKA